MNIFTLIYEETQNLSSKNKHIIFFACVYIFGYSYVLIDV